MTYLGVGFQKLWLPGWQEGEMLYYAFIGVWGTQMGYWIGQLGWHEFIYDWSVFLVKIFEVIMPFLLWIRWKGIR